jgi:PPM family protein phosphatase
MAAVNPRKRSGAPESPRQMPRCTLVQTAALSDRGQVREINEDAVLIEPAGSLEARTRGVLCVLADGMGGYAAGEVASQLAVQRVRDGYYGSASSYMVDALRGAVEAANQDVWQAGRQPEHTGMGSTLTAAVVMHENLVLAHVGDSRAYLVRGRGIAQITEDHSWVAEQVACGALTPEQANNHPQRNVILRALGAGESVEVAVYRETVMPGDALVLCSDGLSTVVSDQEIGHMVRDLPPEEAVRHLVALANSRGAPDNVTVAIVRIPAPTMPWPTRLRHWGPLLAALGGLLALGIIFALLAGAVAKPAGVPQPEGANPTSTPAATPLPTVEPTPEPATESPPAQERTGTISEPDGARLRSAPTIAATNLGLLKRGEKVIVKARIETGWLEVSVRSTPTVGYVRADLVAVDADDPAPAPLEGSTAHE